MSDSSLKIHAFLAHAGVASRRKAEELVQSGVVTVNGQPALIGQRVNPDTDQVQVSGKTVHLTTRHTYVIINKPVDLVSTTADELGRDTVLAVVPEKYQREHLYPVGRLDQDSEGLLLLTNDGEVAQRLTHPSFEVTKTYQVKLDRPPTSLALNHLRRGVKLDGNYVVPEAVEWPLSSELWLSVTLHEGKKHQVKRMMHRLGYEVDQLIRVQMGVLTLEQLGGKAWHELTAEEIQALRQSLGLIQS